MCPDTDERVCRECRRVEALRKLVALYEDSAKQALGFDASQLEELDRPAQIAVVHARAVEIGACRSARPQGSPRPAAGARGSAANHLSTRMIVRPTGKFSAGLRRPCRHGMRPLAALTLSLHAGDISRPIYERDSARDPISQSCERRMSLGERDTGKARPTRVSVTGHTNARIFVLI